MYWILCWWLFRDSLSNIGDLDDIPMASLSIMYQMHVIRFLTKFVVSSGCFLEMIVTVKH